MLNSLLPEYEAAKKQNLDVLLASVLPHVCDGIAPFVQQPRRQRSVDYQNDGQLKTDEARQVDWHKHEAEVAKEHIVRLENSLRSMVKVTRDADVMAAMHPETTNAEGQTLDTSTVSNISDIPNDSKFSHVLSTHVIILA